MSIHVAHLVESMDVEFGGLSRAVADMTTALGSSGISSSIITFASSRSQINASAPIYRVYRRTFGLGTHKLGFWSDPTFLDRFVDEQQIDALHVHGLWRMQSLYAARLADRKGLPVFYSPHGMLSPSALLHSRFTKHVFWRLFQHRFLRTCSGFHVTSRDEQAQVKAVLPSARIVSAPLGVTERLYERRDAPIRSKTLLFIGRVAPIKNLESLIRAWGRAWRSGQLSAWRLLIAGPGDSAYIEHLRALARHVPNVDFLGPCYDADKERLMSSVSAVVLPSFSENFGLVAAEALILGTPIICSKGTPWRSAAEAGCGYWVEGTPQELAVAIVSLASLSETKFSMMSAAAKSYAEENLNMEKNMRTLAAAYSQTVHGRGGL